jgi:hypothetical protein
MIYENFKCESERFLYAFALSTHRALAATACYTKPPNGFIADFTFFSFSGSFPAFV